MRRSIILLAGITCILVSYGCSTRYIITDRGPQAYYQTGFPIHDTSAELARIFRSVKRLQVTGYYTTYRFTQADSITDADLRLRATYRRAAEQFSFDHTKTGTATIIARVGNSFTLITNDHVTRFPDTLVAYFAEDPAPGTRRRPRFVETVSIRVNQRNFVLGLPEVAPFRVLARDSAADLATLTVDQPDAATAGQVAVLRVPTGDPSRLSWGSFVYVLGYPRGFSMVTRGIVSDPNRSRDNAFLVDGLFNRGISGGIILAVRGDTGRLEWVGMASAASAQVEYMLMPERRELDDYGMLMPYDGRLYIERATRIDYGITFSVPMTSIQRFLAAPGRE
jgi:S1-C subfamily serine protease